MPHDNTGVISGIHNYCDRWCERCSFIRRCNVGLSELDKTTTQQEDDLQNQEFWESLKANFKNAVAMIQNAAIELGIDVENVTEEDTRSFLQREADINNQMKQTALFGLCRKYVQQTKAYLDGNEAFKNELESKIPMVEMGIADGREIQRQVRITQDCLQVVHWYEFFIEAKFRRAIHGKLDDDGWFKENGYQSDADGSAKIALIGVERSMQAWVRMMEMYEGEQDNILTLLALLQRIKSEGEKEFPEAYNFIRPGFDDHLIPAAEGGKLID